MQLCVCVFVSSGNIKAYETEIGLLDWILHCIKQFKRQIK